MDDDKHKREVVRDKLIVKYCKPVKEAEVELLNCPFTCAPHPVLHPPVTQTPSLAGPSKNLQLNGGGGALVSDDDLGVVSNPQGGDLQTLMSFQQATTESDSEMMEYDPWIDGQAVRENGRTSAAGVESMELDGNDKGKAKCVGGASGIAKRRRVLPSSMRGEADKNVDEVGRQAAKTANFKELLEAFSVVLAGNTRATNDDESGDFFQTAVSKGMTFPRPRWWPPEGFHDGSSQH